MGNVFSELISATCQAIFPPCLDCISKKVAYIRELEDNVNSLQTELQKLVEAKADVKRRVDIAEQRPQMKRLSQVQGWLSRVEAEETEVGELLRDSSQEIEKLCLGGYCSKNFKSSYEFGKKVANKLQDVVKLKDEGRDFEVVAGKVPEPPTDLIPLQQTIVGLQSIFDKVWKCLVEEEVGIIGIYGTGGVGKTTLLKQINNKFCNELQGFDVVIWVVVSTVPNFEKIQEDIGKKIGLNDESWKTRSLQEKAGDIFKILSSKKFVLLLDDIWKWIDLTEVGVPIPNSKPVSKVVFTTRFFEVCGSMNTNKDFKVEYLTDEEAWKLFEKNLKSEVLEHPDIPQLAKVVAKECGGLPLALVTVSRAMSCKKIPQEWRYAANLLRNSASEFAGMGTEVYPVLKFSYDSLPSDKIRSCLLYCSLYPEDFLINKQQLIECWIGEGFLDDSSRGDVYDQGYHIIGILVHACLLEEEKDIEDPRGDYVVKLHDVIRDMVLWIVNDIEKEKGNFLVEASTGLTEAPEIGKWVGVRKISLMGNKIKIMSQTPTCPDLQTLFLDQNELSIVCDDFFKFMPSLKVLNLSHNRLCKLPIGVSKLVSLQYLDLSYNLTIQELSVELKALTNLKCLSLEYMIRLKTIPCQLMSNLQRLHTLRMYGCGTSVEDGTEDSDLFDGGGGEILVEECDRLEYLNVLSLTLGSYNALQRLLSSVKLQSCTQSLFLKVRCAAMEEIINVEKLGEVSEMMSDLFPFQKLRFLTLWNLYNLKSIFGKALPFPNLREISVLLCPKLKKLPLDSNSAREHKIVIEGQEEWWKELQWEDGATLNAFLPCFRSHRQMNSHLSITQQTTRLCSITE
ncbi:hypothetical protein Pint_30374 [Pistacia integerrima]|uniref:Uncharacterized protein n=1 Tax=Pistacia integerrima TaxID=434235 RepID=A0ACC0X0D7_9ROSI|nr:hypothetical protein Pint_30374 [Pistacia integerrima]